MSKTSINNLARAIYESSLNKDDKQLDVLVKDTVKLLSQKRLLGKSKELLLKLEKIVDKNEEVVRAKISTRNEVDKKEINEIEELIKKRYKAKNAVLEFKTDKKLLGGIKIEVGDEVIDMTLKNKILKLENYLIKN